MALPDYYKLLDLDRTASPEQVWLSYHKIKFLAERGTINRQQKKLYELEQAYYTLIHDASRREYDWFYDRGRAARFSAGLRYVAVPFLTGFFAGVLLYVLLALK